MPEIQLHLGDCLEILPSLSGIDAVVSDPPYGMDWNTDSTRFVGGNRSRRGGEDDGRDDWGGVINDHTQFDPSPWLSFPRVILWGSNHFASKLPVGTTLVWIKKSDDLFGTFLSDAEVAWMKGGHGVYCFRKQFPPPLRIQEGSGSVLHPNQKAISLLRWCIQKLKLAPGSTILDPYMGSGSTGLASLAEGMNFVGIEIDPHYFAVAQRRIERPHATPLRRERHEPLPLFDA